MWTIFELLDWEMGQQPNKGFRFLFGIKCFFIYERGDLSWQSRISSDAIVNVPLQVKGLWGYLGFLTDRFIGVFVLQLGFSICSSESP